MARNDDGEFELIVGNKQLLTIVFIIFVLCGIVFTMGYFVGRNSGPPLSAAANGKDASPSPAAGTKPAPAAEQDPAPSAQLQPGEAKVATPDTAAPAPQPQQAQQPPAETAAPPVPVKQTPTAATPAKPEPKPAEPAPASGSPREPVPGQTYVQVAAVARPMAETLVDVLQKKSFPAFVAPGPNDTIFRVLVGPVKDSGAAAKMKADLAGVGIKDTRVKKF